MLKRFRRVHDDDSGFTLTELLITIVILGVLASIVVFSITAFTNDGKTVACKTDKRSVEVAADAYKAKMGAYPQQGTDVLRIGELVNTFYLKAPPSTTNNYTITLDINGVVGPAVCP